MRSPVLLKLAAVTMLAVGSDLLGALNVSAQPGRIELVGDYRYTYHDPETVADAKNTACREALRLAITTSPQFREHTAPLVDSSLLREVAHTLASQYVKDQQILEQTEKGRTVSCRVKAVLQADDLPHVILAQTGATGQTPGVIDQNRALRVLSVREENDGTISVIYQAIKRLDWIGTAYAGSLREAADLMVDFYDDQGVLIRTDRYPARKTMTGDDVMNPGEIGIHRIAKPLSAKTYRVWVVK